MNTLPISTGLAAMMVTLSISYTVTGPSIETVEFEPPVDHTTPHAVQGDLPSRYIAKSLLPVKRATLIKASPPVVTVVAMAAPRPTRKPQPVVAPADLEHWFETYGNAFGVDPNVLKHIARCESGFNPGSQGGPYGGMFQYHANTWASTRNAMGLDPDPDLRYNAEEAIKTSAWKISAGGIGAWPHCSRQIASATISN